MAKSVEFNPRGTFVASKSGGMILASRKYQLGETIDKTGLSRRKLLQLWAQGRIAYAWMVDAKQGTTIAVPSPAPVEVKVEKLPETKVEKLPETKVEKVSEAKVEKKTEAKAEKKLEKKYLEDKKS
jgi:hypothetical protein